MDKASRSYQKSINVWSGLFCVICIGSVVFYWSVAPNALYPILAGIMLSYLVLWGMIFLFSNASNSEKTDQFFLCTGSVILTVGFLELFVVAYVVDFRTVFGTSISEPWRHPANLYDLKLLHIHKPYDHWLWKGIEYRYDQYGFRNETDVKSADIIVVGDSFIEGWNVPSDELLTKHLTRQLDRPVANLGQSWYGPNQELEVLQRYGLKLTPKVCVWVFFEGNDLYDMHRYKEATQDWESYSKDFHSFRQRSFTKNAVLASGRIVHTLQNLMFSRVDQRKESSGIFTSTSEQKIRLYFQYKGHYLSDNDRTALKDLRLILGQAHNLCHTAGAKFLLVFAPTKFRVYRNVTEFDPHDQARYWVINDLPQKIEAMLVEDFPDGKFLDLTTPLVAQAKQSPLLYIDDDSHWSAEGHRVVASAIANVLKQWL